MNQQSPSSLLLASGHREMIFKSLIGIIIRNKLVSPVMLFKHTCFANLFEKYLDIMQKIANRKVIWRIQFHIFLIISVGIFFSILQNLWFIQLLSEQNFTIFSFCEIVWLRLSIDRSSWVSFRRYKSIVGAVLYNKNCKWPGDRFHIGT